MSQSLGLLKHIPCPKGDDCTAFRCLFRHKGDEEAWPLPSDNQVAQQPGTPQSSKADFTDQSQPRKRQKVADDAYDPASPALPGLKDSVVVPDPVPTNHVNVPSPTSHVDTRPVTTSRPVSPPPLKRKAAPTLVDSPGRGKALVSAHNGSPVPNKETPVKKPTDDVKLPARKKEGLNPRMLKSSPASHETRHKILKALHAELVRLNKEVDKTAKGDDRNLVLSEQELIYLALDEEEKHARDKPAIYSNTIKHRIVAYKKMAVDSWIKERRAAYLMTNGSLAKALDASPTSKPIVTGLTTEEEVYLLKSRLQTPITNLAQYGYVPTVPSDEGIQKAREADELTKGWEVCDRCQSRFQVFPGRREEDGALASGGVCTHHPGRTYYPQRQAAGDRSGQERRYKCCGQGVGDSTGCATAETHVWKTTSKNRLASLWNFAETPANAAVPSDRAVCFDCEMGYTVNGFELIRLTATSWPGGEELLDVLVQPTGEILDLNSRYSGVWPEDIVNALPFSATAKPPPTKQGERKRLPMVSSPIVARDLLFSLISPETPLIGHGLENDLNSVRIVHPTLVDSILLYPHSRGLPLRNGLKYLTQFHLGRTIQADEVVDGKVQGHDSGEDARAAGDLVRLRVKKEWEDMKKLGWTLVEGKFVAPGAK